LRSPPWSSGLILPRYISWYLYHCWSARKGQALIHHQLLDIDIKRISFDYPSGNKSKDLQQVLTKVISQLEIPFAIVSIHADETLVMQEHINIV